MSSVHQLALNQLYASLELDRKAIGVRFLFTKEEYDACPVPPAKAKMAYCVMVKVASSGICLKADLSLFGCGGATVEDVALMKSLVGDKVKVKAAGGIRTLETAIEMINAGAERIGSTASVKIVEELMARL